ncbi:MAG: SDR family oxidoreductase [Deltaproteobacteria bacterium]|nr:SDR family oxidoreductase [Deltaproteobacteria bacterium]
MKIGVIGGTRGIGRELVRLAAKGAHQVTVLARDPGRVDEAVQGLRVVKGDARDSTAVADLIVDQDVICSCLGVSPSIRAIDLFSESTSLILSQVPDEHGCRILVVTGIGAGDSRGHGGFMYDKIIRPLLLGRIYEDKDRQEQLLCNSKTNWTIIRPGSLTNGPRTGKYQIIRDMTGVTLGKISRADVADFMVSEIEQPKCERGIINLCY